MKEFCEYCGAGIGKFRRKGEGTCEKCDPEGVKQHMKQLGLHFRCDDDDEFDRFYRCSTCGDSSHPEDLCSCCSRCLDCLAEMGHRRKRIVGDEIEEYNERGGEG